jgi:hypothetical protein
MVGPTRNRTPLIDRHPKLVVALVVAGMTGGVLLRPSQIEFWIALALLAIFVVGFSGRLRN